jgi:integrase
MSTSAKGEHALKFIQKRKSDHIANGTINRELAILRRALNLGAQHDPPLVSRVIHIPRLKENNIRIGFFEEEQYRLLLAELPERLKLLLVIAYHTGVRKGELLRIRVEQIDLRRKQIRLNAGETKKRRRTSTSDLRRNGSADRRCACDTPAGSKAEQGIPEPVAVPR